MSRPIIAASYWPKFAVIRHFQRALQQLDCGFNAVMHGAIKHQMPDPFAGMLLQPAGVQ